MHKVWLEARGDFPFALSHEADAKFYINLKTVDSTSPTLRLVYQESEQETLVHSVRLQKYTL